MRSGLLRCHALLISVHAALQTLKPCITLITISYTVCMEGTTYLCCSKMALQLGSAVIEICKERCHRATPPDWDRICPPLDHLCRRRCCIRYCRQAQQSNSGQHPTVCNRSWRVWLDLRSFEPEGIKGLENSGKTRRGAPPGIMRRKETVMEQLHR